MFEGFEVRFWWFWKKLGPFFINKVRKQFGFWWCSRGLKFGFGPKWVVRMCSKFNPLRFGMFEVWFFDIRSTSRSNSSMYLTTTRENVILWRIFMCTSQWQCQNLGFFRANRTKFLKILQNFLSRRDPFMGRLVDLLILVYRLLELHLPNRSFALKLSSIEPHQYLDGWPYDWGIQIPA